MNREILFGGKRVDNGEWVYGIPIQTHISTFIVFEDNPHYCSQYGYMEIDGLVKVIPETVGEYTGLTDKNGKMIFDGAIVRHHNDNLGLESEEKGVVFWDEKTCGWRRTSNGYFHNGIVKTYRLSPECIYEVIGNIHDNPELLER